MSFERSMERARARRERVLERQKRVYHNARRLGYSSYEAGVISGFSNEKLEQEGFDVKELIRER